MVDEAGTLVLPTTFIPAAERYGLMPQIDYWVVRTFLAHIEQFCQETTSSAQISQNTPYMINLSGASLSDDQFLSLLRTQLNQHPIAPQTICFEITETAAISNLNQAVNFIHELKQLGCQFALDDFGSGMSSFGYLKTLPVDYVKIDGKFIEDMASDPTAAAIVESINHIGHVIGLQTIAEWVDNAATRERLGEIGVDYVQGYGISIPAPLAL